jgi:hypothetical protein
MKSLPHYLLLVLVPLLAGCTALDLNLSDFGREADQTAGVGEIVCLWEAAEGVGLDGLPTRGFAGQVLFFVKGQSTPVRINGDVRVYVFDDQGTADEQARPLHEFNFPAEAWNSYLTQTNLGPAYQLFVPYTRKGSHFAKCELRVRLTAQDRLPAYSKLAMITLPGRKSLPGAIQQAAASAGSAEPERDLQSLAEQAAIQKMSAQFGVGKRTQQFNRLHQAAASAVRTADYSEEPTGEPAATSADYETESPQSRRYQISRTRELR